MEDLKIGLEKDNGSISGYNIDTEIINGLYSTTDTIKVNENIKNFNIEIEQISNGVAQKLSKRNSVVIATILIDDMHKFQFLVGKDMDLVELEKTSDIPSQIKQIIRDAYNLTNDTTLGDLLK